MARKSRMKSNSIRVDFKGVEGKLSPIPDGEYNAKVVEVTKEDGQAAEYLKWTFELTDEEFEGRKVFLNTSLAPQALWNLRGLLEAIGVDVPDDELDIDLSDLTDRDIGLLIENETYEGKKRPRVSDYFPLDGESQDEEEEEEEEPKSKRKARSRDDDEDEEDEPKSKRKSRRSRDDDEEEEDPKRSRRSRDDDEEEEPKSKRKSSKKKAKGPTEDDINEMSEDELEELVEEHELELDLQEYRTLTKKRNHVIDAMSEAGIL